MVPALKGSRQTFRNHIAAHVLDTIINEKALKDALKLSVSMIDKMKKINSRNNLSIDMFIAIRLHCM